MTGPTSHDFPGHDSGLMTYGLPLLAVAILACVLPAASPAATTQQMLRPPSPLYRIGGFMYEAPTGAGWRELSSSSTSLELVYVEMVAENKINSRGHVVIQASKVPKGADVGGAEDLARLSRDEQAAARKDSLVENGEVARIPGETGFYTYKISSRLQGVDLTELFYILLATDGSEYLVVKLATKDADFEKTPYYSDIYASLASFTFRPKTPEAPATAP